MELVEVAGLRLGAVGRRRASDASKMFVGVARVGVVGEGSATPSPVERSFKASKLFCRKMSGVAAKFLGGRALGGTPGEVSGVGDRTVTSMLVERRLNN